MRLSRLGEERASRRVTGACDGAPLAGVGAGQASSACRLQNRLLSRFSWSGSGLICVVLTMPFGSK